MDVIQHSANMAEHGSAVVFTTTGDNYGYQSTVHNEYTSIRMSMLLASFVVAHNT